MDRLRVTHIRNSTLLLDFDGYRVLTDPWFTRNAHGWPVWAMPGVDVDELGTVDLVVVSHFHPDHFAGPCARHVARNNPGVPFVGPGGAAARFARSRVTGEGFAAGESRAFGPVTLHAVACKHAEADPKQVNFVFEWSGGALYFGGDARLGPEFARCGEAFDVDVALLPVGGTRVCGCKLVMGPGDALQAAEALGARYAIPIHEGGLWPTLPPLYFNPGRARRFEQLARRSGTVASVRLTRGQHAQFERLDGQLVATRVGWAPGAKRPLSQRVIGRMEPLLSPLS